MSKVLTSFQVRFPVGVFALQFLPSSVLVFRASQRFANREPTGRVFSQFHSAEGLFHRSFIGTFARVFHVIPPQKIMRRDPDVRRLETTTLSWS